MLSYIVNSAGEIAVTHPELALISYGIIFMLWRASAVIRQYLNRPRNMRIYGYTLAFGQWLSILDFVSSAADRITYGYKHSTKRPFAIPAISNYQVLVSSPEHIKELGQAPDESFSFHQAMADRLFFKYTMAGFEPDNGVDVKNRIPIRVFKVLVRENLTKLSKTLQIGVSDVIDALYMDRLNGNDSVIMPLNVLSTTLIARMNNTVFFGSDLANKPGFEKASMRFAWHSGIAMEILRQIPHWFVPLVAKIFMAWSGAMNTVFNAVLDLVYQRLEQRKQTWVSQGERRGQLDCTEWVISSSHTPDQLQPTRIAQQMVALLFASTHQMQMALTWAIMDLCLHPEYIEILRSEIKEAFSSKDKDPYTQLYFLECFLRESSRLNPIDCLNVQRKSVAPYTFSGGFHVPTGTLVAIPQREILRDASLYPRPETFNPSRFMHKSEHEANAKYTDVNWKYPYWGSPRLSCPGRFYVSYALKHALVHLLTTYDISLRRARTRSRDYFIWTTALVPNSDLCITMTKRV